MALAERTQASQTRGMVIPNKKSKGSRERDKVWRKILQALQVMEDDDSSDGAGVEAGPSRTTIGRRTQDALYNQLTQHTKSELLAHIQIVGLS